MMSLQPYVEDGGFFNITNLLLFIQAKITQASTYMGVPCAKNPLDLWIYQEILHEVRPDVIVEIGTFRGGSALWLAHLCDALGKGRVISVDVNPIPKDVSHPRITFLTGGSANQIEKVKDLCYGNSVLVIEDSSHEYDQCLDVLRKYSQLVTKGSYLIVEDTICHHGLNVGPKPGPWEAVSTFLEENKNFVADRSREPYIVTWNPRGYLKRVQ